MAQSREKQGTLIIMTTQLDLYLNTWSLTEPEHLAETPTSQVFTVLHQGERVILKLLTPIGVEDEQNGAIALHLWDGHGAVRLIRQSTDAHLLEYASGEEVTALVHRGEDEQAAIIIAGVLNQLHAASPAEIPAQITPLTVRFRRLFAYANTDPLLGHGAQIARTLLADPRDVVLLHGDMHHANIRQHPRRGWLAFDPKGVSGERTYDCANTLCNPPSAVELVHNEGRLLKIAGILAQQMALEESRVLAYTFAYACLSASWSLDIGHEAEAEYAFKVARIIEPHLGGNTAPNP